MSWSDVEAIRRSQRAVPRAAWQLVVLAALWWLLTGGAGESWLIGIPTVLAAFALSRKLAPARGWNFSLPGLLVFVPHFVRLSLWGAIDVAWRVVHPRLPIDPQMIEYDVQLSTPAARVFFMNVCSLLPGTVAVDAREGSVAIHALDRQMPVVEHLRELERLVSAVFQESGTEVGGQRSEVEDRNSASSEAPASDL